MVFPVIFLSYWVIPVRFQEVRKWWLVIVSYLLYMSWKPAFALVLFAVTLETYFGARAIEKSGSGKIILGWTFAFLALCPLLIFKYYNFINDSFYSFLDSIGFKFSLPGLNWAVPVGLSFFSLQAVGYFLDVYRGTFPAEKHLVDYLLFVSFFPQIASGPISKAGEFLPQIKQLHPFSYEQGKQGLKYLLWGMFLKVVIADRLGIYVDNVYASYLNHNGTTLFLTSIFYSMQIYCDFAGYSLMAVGIGRLLGFNLINNFRRPYFAVSITGFWRRWHISLTRWLRENIYIPLGGNRCSKARCFLNILITFFVSGLWHGAAWTFVLWGAMHGIIQILEKWVGFSKFEETRACVRVPRIILTFLLVNFAWVFFRSPNVSTAFSFIGRIFASVGVPEIATMGGTVFLILLVSLSILFFKETREEFFPEKLSFLEARIPRRVAYMVLFCMIVLFGVHDGGQFIYAEF